MPDVSFRCYYPDGSHTNHHQAVLYDDIGYWIDCYKFTHPACVSISVRVWFSTENNGEAVD